MSLDRSLKSASSLVRHRNVLTRPERLQKLAEEEKWNDSKSVFGLPKVAHRKLTVGGKGGKEEAAAGAEGAAAPAAGAAAGATAAKPAAAGGATKAPAPAAAAKAAAGAKPAAGAAAPAAGAKKK